VEEKTAVDYFGMEGYSNTIADNYARARRWLVSKVEIRYNIPSRAYCAAFGTWTTGPSELAA
jgi:hypothetical protein